MLPHSIRSSFSTLLKSNYLIFNNSYSLQSLNQSMVLYFLSPSLTVGENSQGEQTVRINAGKIGMHLVETRLQFTKGVPRYHYFLNLQDTTRFLNRQFESTLPFTFGYMLNHATKQTRNLDIRYKQDLKSSVMTFYDLDKNKVKALKRLSVEEEEMLVMKQIIRSGMYELAGLGLEYQLKYDEILDQIIDEVNNSSQNIEIEREVQNEEILQNRHIQQQHAYFSRTQEEQYLQNEYIL